MHTKNDFTKAGFSVINTETNENKLLNFLKENYPGVVRDNEIKLNELKAVLLATNLCIPTNLTKKKLKSWAW